jgi:hypothetical protein
VGDIPIIGIDLGYGQVKAAGPGYRASFPALVAEKVVWSESTWLMEWDNARNRPAGHLWRWRPPAVSSQHTNRTGPRWKKAKFSHT